MTYIKSGVLDVHPGHACEGGLLLRVGKVSTLEELGFNEEHRNNAQVWRERLTLSNRKPGRRVGHGSMGLEWAIDYPRPLVA